MSYKFEPITVRKRKNLQDSIELFRVIDDEGELVNDICNAYEKKKSGAKK